MKEDYTEYDIKPSAFLNYLRYYGPHFNKKLAEFACKLFTKIEFSKEKLEELLKNNNILLENAKLSDVVYVAHLLRYTFYGSGVTDDRHWLLAIKDVFEKEGDLIFNGWYANCAKRGISIEWEDMI